jgi:hypothetical protein
VAFFNVGAGSWLGHILARRSLIFVRNSRQWAKKALLRPPIALSLSAAALRIPFVPSCRILMISILAQLAQLAQLVELKGLTQLCIYDNHLTGVVPSPPFKQYANN